MEGLKRSDCSLYYEHASSPTRTARIEPEWLHGLLGDEFFQDVATVNAYDDTGMKYLKGLPRLEELTLCHVTDAGMENVEGLTRLRSVQIIHTRITDNRTPASPAATQRIVGVLRKRRRPWQGEKSGSTTVSVPLCTFITDECMKRLQKGLPTFRVTMIDRNFPMKYRRSPAK